MNKYIVKTDDTKVKAVIRELDRRSQAGLDKYGTSLDRNDLNPSEWLQHLQEELMDAVLYIEKLKEMISDG